MRPIGPIDLSVKKEVHIKLLQGTKAAFKACVNEFNLSMQAVLIELVQRVVERDQYMDKLMREMVRRNMEKEVLSLSEPDADFLLDRIEDLKELKK